MSAPDLSAEQIAAIDRMVDALEQDDLYALLGVHHDADANAIQAAYYGLSRSWHPDRFFRKDLGEYAERIELAFVGITQGYKTLTDPVKRRTYDREHRARIDRQVAQAAEERERAERKARREGRPPPTEPTGAPRRESIRERLARNAERRSPESRAAGERLRRKMMEQVREQVGDRIRKARTMYEAGRADWEAGKVIKAAGSLELAVQYDPDNDEYRELLDQVKVEARKVRILSLIAQGEQAESYQQSKQAIQAYRDAANLGATDGKVYFRLARLVRADEGDDREALRLLREAVHKSPEHPEYRMGLGQLYRELGMKLNARREFQAVLDREPANAEARAALKEL